MQNGFWQHFCTALAAAAQKWLRVAFVLLLWIKFLLLRVSGGGTQWGVMVNSSRL